MVEWFDVYNNKNEKRVVIRTLRLQTKRGERENK
jgi:hypothetical protein